MKLTKGASEATQKYMADGIRYVCENFKERSPGSHSERKAQKYLKNKNKTNLLFSFVRII